MTHRFLSNAEGASGNPGAAQGQAPAGGNAAPAAARPRSVHPTLLLAQKRAGHTPGGANAPAAPRAPGANGGEERAGEPRERRGRRRGGRGRRRGGRGTDTGRNGGTPDAAAASPADAVAPVADAPLAASAAPAAEPAPRAPRPERGPRNAPEPIPPPPETPLPEDSPFRQFGFGQPVLDGIARAGYTAPTPIQEQAIPLVLNGRDLVASAQTGTGKTAAFALPVLQRLGQHGTLRCLILEPTRELAVQVEEAFRTLGAYTGMRTTAFYGGVGYGPQRDAMARGIDVLVATPGRLLDHLQNRALTLDTVEILILDEVDRMLDMGFLPQVRRVVQRCPSNRQTLLFSATIPDEIGRLAGWALREPQRLEIGIKRSPADTIAHALYPVDIAQKFDLLMRLLAGTEYKSVLIFCRTKVGSDRIYEWLRAHGHNVGVIHADRTQAQRMEALRKFKAGEIEVLVATDIAARGLDIAGVTHVVNYDIPENPEDYVHRIGRTGRAQREGDALTLVTWQDEAAVSAIERYIGRKIERKKAEGFAYEKYPELINKQAAGPVRSFRFRGRL